MWWTLKLAKAPVLPIVFLLVGGCFAAPAGPGDRSPQLLALPDELGMGEFKVIAKNETAGRWEWKATVPPWVRGAPGTPPILSSRFQVPAHLPLLIDLRYAAAYSGVLEQVRAILLDDKGGPRCFGSPSARCYLPMQEALEVDETWTLQFWPEDSRPPGTNVHAILEMTLLPPFAVAPMAYGSGGARPLPVFLEGSRFLVHPTGLETFEPNIGVTTKGNVFVTASQVVREPNQQSMIAVLRSGDQGRSWEYRSATERDLGDGDPWMWVDRDTNRVFRVAWTSPCAWLSVSDDEGQTWSDHPGAGCGLQAGHYEKLTTGPPPRGVTTNGYRNIVYYVSSLFIDPSNPDGPVGPRGVWATTSLDGGKTWRIGSEAHPWRPGCQGWGGPIVVAPDGTAFSPAMYCDGVRMATSVDGGLTWRHDASLNDKGHMGGLLGPHMGTDNQGRAYLFYPGRDGHAYLRYRDPISGQWSAAVDVTPPGVKATTFHVMRAAGPGRVALAFFGTDSDPATWKSMNPLHAPPGAAWHMYVALSWDALGADPGFVAYRLTPDHDPIQRGCIDLQGSQTPSCRNLDDFMDLALHEGRPFVAYPDGCLACPDAQSSRAANLVVAAFQDGFDLSVER